MSKLSLIFLLSVLAAQAQTSKISSEVCKHRTEEVFKTLSDNVFLNRLDDFGTGNGIAYDWRNSMNAVGVKHVTALVVFEYKGQEINLSLQKVFLSSRYYNYGAAAEVKNNTDKTKSLIEELKIPLFSEALNLIKNTKAKDYMCGEIEAQLFDDACLPAIYTTSSISLRCSKLD